jgi:hypothetical protein
MLRKAASALDFRSIRPGDVTVQGVSGGGTLIEANDLGLLTPFYSVETGTFVPDHDNSGGGTTAGAGGSLSTAHHKNSGGVLYAQHSASNSLGGSLNASSGSLNTLRASTSHAVLSYGGGGAASVPLPAGSPNGTMRHASSSSGLSALGSSAALSSLTNLQSSASGGRAPLVAHFSLSGAPKSNGQPRGSESELAMLTEKLREMQYEMSRLHRKLRERDADAEQWSVRYGRRAVLACQALLTCSSFLLQFGETLSTKSVASSWLHRIFIPPHIYSMGNHATAAAAASQVAAVAGSVAAAAKARSGRQQVPLSAVLLSGCLSGFMAAFPFALSFALQLRGQAWPRNVGSLVSGGYSAALLLLSRYRIAPHARPPLAHFLNVSANVMYVGARYYFLHGLLVFSSMRIL